MILQKIFKEENIDYKIIDEDVNVVLYKINSKLHILCIESKNGQFLLHRDFFDYLNNNRLPYAIFLNDFRRKKYYYLELPKENNWIKSSFKTCQKDEIYLGKQVLNAQITLEGLKAKIQKCKG